MTAPELPSVLIVDDTPTNITLLAHALSERYRIRVATTGALALEICRAGDPPQLVLLDVMMPEMDGQEVCRRLKADPSTAGIPVLFVTGDTTVSSTDECLEAGGADCVSKPLHVGLLRRRIETHLELARARERLAQLSGAPTPAP